MTEHEKNIEARLQVVAKAIIAKKGRPSQEDMDSYFSLVRELPVPDFTDWSERERANNTERYKKARRETRRKLGLKDES